MNRRDAWHVCDRMRVYQNGYFKNFAKQFGREHSSRWSGFDNLAVLHQQNVIGKLCCKIEIVRDDERGRAVLIAAIPDQRQQLDLLARHARPATERPQPHHLLQQARHILTGVSNEVLIISRRAHELDVLPSLIPDPVMMKLLPLVWSRPSIIERQGGGDARSHRASISPISSKVSS